MESPPPAAPPWSRPGAAAWSLVALAVLPFLNALGNAFVAGDQQFLVGNDLLQRPGFFLDAFTNGYWHTEEGGGQGYMYRPLTVLANALELQLWGEQPLPFHLTNILLHALCTLGVFQLVARLLPGAAHVAWLTAALFAVHPIHVHAVSYIQGRTGLLCAAPYLWGIVLVCAGRAGGGARRLLAVLALYATALLAKETAITWPAIAAACLLYQRATGRPLPDRRALGALAAGVVAITVAYFTLRVSVLGSGLGTRRPLHETLGVLPWLLTCAKVLSFYLGKLALPLRHDFLPPFLPVFEAGDARGWGALTLCLGWAAAIIAPTGRRDPTARLRTPATRLWLLWIAATLAPFSGVLPLGYLVKENYAYLPSVGFCALLGMGLGALATRLRPGTSPARRALGAAVAALLLLGVLQSQRFNRHWRDEATFYAHIIAAEPEIPDARFAHPAMLGAAYRYGVARLNYGLQLGVRRCDEAMPHYRRATALLAGSAGRQADMLIADCHLRSGRVDEAVALWTRAVAQKHAYSGVAAAQLADHLAAEGDAAGARDYQRRACALGLRARCADTPGARPTDSGEEAAP